MENGDTIVALDKEKLKTVLDWFSENKPSCEESFYQVDSINLNLPDLGIAVFNLLVDSGFYVPEE